MKNFIHPGNILTFTAADVVASGQGVMQGALFGVATTNADAGEDFEAQVVGVFELPKTGGAITKGAKVYWSSADNAVTGTASGNTLIGAAVMVASAGADVARVRLNGSV